MAGSGVERLEAEVVEDQEIGAAESLDETPMVPVAPRERDVFAELRPTTERLSRRAFWPMAQASQLLPVRLGPTRARLS